MSESTKSASNAPATFGAAVERVAHLSHYSEADILELVSTGKISDLSPLKPVKTTLPSDTVEENELIEASPLPLSSAQRNALIQSNTPGAARVGSENVTTKKSDSER